MTNSTDLIKEWSIQFNKRKVKQIKLVIPNYGVIPDGLQGAGHKAWTFIDEIKVN